MMRQPDWRDRITDQMLVDLGDGRSLHGFVDTGFGQVMDAFVDNYRRRDDLGSGCAIEFGGRTVVDVWGGTADARSDEPWHRDTAAVIFSCTKGILAVCVYLLVQEGRLDLDAPVSRYWPEFGMHGKDRTTLRQAMSHRAGVPALDGDLTRDQVIAWDPVIAAIEGQAPLFLPDDGFVYHAMTYGWLVGEVIRRLTGASPGRYFRSVVGDPLDLDTWIGLEPGRESLVAFMEPPLPDEDSDDAREAARLFASEPIIERSLTMGAAYAFPADERGYVSFNDRDIQRAEIPGANGISSPRSLARLYAACVAETDGRPPLLSQASIEDALTPRSWGRQLTGSPDDGARWGTGFQISSPPSQPMLGSSSFGHAGAGGQLAFADLDHRVGFAYLSNQMGGYGDARARSLTEALRRCLG